MTNPRYSIVIPVYNRAATIGDTLKSVLKQTFTNYEVVIVDDGSDDSAELQDVIAAFNDSRFKYVHRQNGGGGAARNTGIRAAIGDYIAFLDSDDFFLDDKLAKVDAVLGPNHDPKVAIYSYMYVKRGEEQYWVRPERPIGPAEDVGEYLFVSNQFIQTSTLILDRQTALEVPFDDSLRKGQDLDLCVRLGEAGVTFKMMEEPLTIWVDMSEGGRTSRVAGYEAPSKWLESHRNMLTEKAYYGYRATVLAYYIGWHKPLRAACDIWNGYARAGVPLKITLRQYMRTFLPKGLYRSLVSAFISLKGKKEAK